MQAKLNAHSFGRRARAASVSTVNRHATSVCDRHPPGDDLRDIQNGAGRDIRISSRHPHLKQKSKFMAPRPTRSWGPDGG